jgi:transcriptional regulator of arginine metabolism
MHRDANHRVTFSFARKPALTRPEHENEMKTQRHNAIRELLEKAAVSNQDALRRKLASKGFHVTQATLSRDIRELKLLKGPGGYALPFNGNGSADENKPELIDVISNFGLEVVQAQNLLVFHTTTGGAQPIAAGIDYEDWAEVVGTIAGDNTVLIICPDNRKAATLKTRLDSFIV